MKQEEIGKFLHGFNEDEKYLVNIEGFYDKDHVMCFYHYPDGTKKVVEYKYKPFLYIKDFKSFGLNLYPNDSRSQTQRRLEKANIKIKELKTGGNDRLEKGYKYIVYGPTISAIQWFFKSGGVDIGWNSEFKDLRLSYSLKPEEQFMIQKGIRLYKGFDSYNDIHKCCFDIETTGLDPYTNRIFMIGIKDNRGYKKVLGVNKENDDEEELRIIREFINIYAVRLKPAIITHYNGEDFDWNFIFVRCEILNYDYKKIVFNGKVGGNVLEDPSTISNSIFFKRVPNATLKIGGETHRYTRTDIWGISNIDIIHAAKRTQVINSDIQNVRLKYICKFEKIAKPNRMYLKGDMIYKTWENNKNYVINPKNNLYRIIPEEYQGTSELYLKKLKKSNEKEQKLIDFYQLKDKNDISDLTVITGKEIVTQYLIDDLIETEAVDSKYNESSFLLAQMIPTTYQRICTMGSAAVWKLIMSAWSYENELAIPIPDEKDKFSGGLARAYFKGYAENLSKIDFAGLYPTIQLTYDAFPDADITNILKKLLFYTLSTRNKFKALSTDDSLTDSERSFYKTKQLPLKILNNSLFGALGSGEAFPWGESQVAARITCIGRLELRRMIVYFMKYNYTPILAVTDGVNFALPKTVSMDLDGNVLDNPIPLNDLKITVGGKEYIGHDAVVEHYNENILKFSFDNMRLIKLDNDGMFKSSLTLTRINYALMGYDTVDKATGAVKKGKIKLTGNTIKSKVMPEYIEEFIDKAMDMVLNNKGPEFVEYYYQYLEDLYYKQIPLKKIASKSRVKMSVKDYLDRGTDKNGKPKARQAHMELAIAKNIEPEIGELIYYVNIGTAKSHGDSKILIDKKTKEEYIASYMIDAKDIENNPDMLGDYNYKKYIASFNKVVENVFVMFKDGILEKMLKENPQKKEYLTDVEMEFVLKENDPFDPSMMLEELEVQHWNDTGYDPKTIFEDFTLPEDEHLDGVKEYNETLCKLNRTRKKHNKPLIKAIYDNKNEGEFVLKKNRDVFTVHQVDTNGYLNKIHQL